MSMAKALRTLVAVMLALQIGYLVANWAGFRLGGSNYLEAPIASLIALYIMLVVTVALLFVLVMYKER